VFINNAALSPPSGFYHKLSAEMVDNLVAINCASVVKATYAVLPSMLARGKGAIVNVSSVAGVPASRPMASLYSSTKSFVIQFSLSLSDEYKDKGIDIQVRPPSGIMCMSSTGPAREKKKIIITETRVIYCTFVCTSAAIPILRTVIRASHAMIYKT
jgi:short-subunit dehydrogenase